MDFKKLEKFLKDEGQPAFRLKQIKKAVFQDGIISFDEISVLPKILRDLSEKNFKIMPFKKSEVFVSGDKKAYKAILYLVDDKIIETVLMEGAIENNWSLCVSTQAGCAMRCAFCATGAGGFIRNLSAEEIWGQVLFWKSYMRKEKIIGKISNVVYMGMGEPFNNLENVFESIKILIDKDAFGMGQRSISVSSCGILPGIEKFAKEFPQVNLAISLHAANDKLRSDLMPINKSYNLKDLAGELKKYLSKSKRKVFIEYILLDGVNDDLKNARELINYLRSIGYPHLLHMNLIVFNPPQRIIESPFKPSSRNQSRKFQEFLKSNGFNATIRKSLGQDIQGACGQLAGKSCLSADRQIS